MTVTVDHAKETISPSAYEALLITGTGVDSVFDRVYHVPQLSGLRVAPSVSRVRFVESRTIETSDPFAYNHILIAEGVIKAIATPGELPPEEWDY
jgi:hypothetical protein